MHSKPATTGWLAEAHGRGVATVSDSKLKSTFKTEKGRDWPLDYDELEPWYCEAEWELGVSGNHEELDGLFGAYRSRPFPMRGIPLSYSDRLIKKRIEGKN